MPAPASDAHVTAIVVACNGGSWLPRTLAAIEGQTRSPDRTIGADAGSTDGSAALLAAAPLDAVVASPAAGFGEAVAAALRAADDRPVPPSGGVREPVGPGAPPTHVEWLWLLHDDSAPQPQALAALLQEAARSPRAAVLGAKARGWNDPSLLLECGFTMTDSGRRGTGIVPGDRDQGQRDDQRQVLAVGTAGMLVRRDLYEELGGFDPALPTFGDDLEFCLRARRAGADVLVVPQAVVHHREAGRHGVRPTAGPARSPDLLERAAGFHIVLVHTPALMLPFTSARLLLRTLVTSLLLFVTESPRAAVAELGVWASVHLRPGTVAQARRRAAASAVVPRRELRHLRPRWTEQVGSAFEHAAERRTADPARRTAGHRVAALAALVAGLAAVAAVATRTVWTGAGPLAGGALLPVPDGTALWAAFRSAWQDVGLGSAEPAAPYLFPILAAAVPPGVGTGTIVTMLLLATVPLAGASAFLALRGVLPTAVRAVLAAAYALTPAAVAPSLDGRLGTAVAAVGLPPLLRLGVRLVAGDLPGAVLAAPRLRTAAGAALLLCVLVAFAPVLWIAAWLLLPAGAAAAGWPRPFAWPARWARVLLVLLAPAVVLWPWSGALLADPSRFAFEAGVPLPVLPQPSWQLLLLDPGGLPAAAAVAAVPLLLGALLALLAAGSRPLATWCWVVVAVGLALAVAQTVRGYVPVGGTVPLAGYPGPALLLSTAGMAGAVAAAAAAAWPPARAGARRHRRSVAGAVSAVFLLSGPLLLAVLWTTELSGPLQRSDDRAVPAFVAEEALGPDRIRTLLLDRQPDGSVGYTLVNGRGLRLGDADVQPPPQTLATVSAAVSALVGGTGPEPARVLGARAVRYVVADAADLPLVAALDGSAALRRLSTASGRGLWLVVGAAPRAVLGAASTDPAPGAGAPVPMATGGQLTSRAPVLDAPVAAPAEGGSLVLAVAPDQRWRFEVAGQDVPADPVGDVVAAALPPGSGPAEARAPQVVVTFDQGDRDRGLLLALAGLLVLLLLLLPAPGRTPDLDPDAEVNAPGGPA
jgi:GT2 family glycosyltransferase